MHAHPCINAFTNCMYVAHMYATMRALHAALLPPAVLHILTSGSTSWLGLLMLLLWAVFKGGEQGWKYLKADPQAGGRVTSKSCRQAKLAQAGGLMADRAEICRVCVCAVLCVLCLCCVLCMCVCLAYVL
jgi:hypothetical protein